MALQQGYKADVNFFSLNTISSYKAIIKVTCKMSQLFKDTQIFFSAVDVVSRIDWPPKT